ncbi:MULTISPECIES: universal stress protein [Bacillaceae]|uniref:Phosphate starvation protein n=1 Tax=Domibacillus aminovorans TaxID=29332 RepID=A0A177L1P1_9BACI|nr:MULTISPECIES: universal stress protein [Bacillaceae]OAH59590.1 phosphate starvation protein [Domibacillus aminovorans]
MSKIVVAYDGSELSKKALERAIILAKQDEKVELNVITAIPRPIASIYNYGAIADTAHEANLEVAREMMKEVEGKLEMVPNKTETFIIDGNPAQTIEEFAKNNNVDLIVMGSRGLGGVKELFLGSVSHHVVQKAKSEVFIVK